MSKELKQIIRDYAPHMIGVITGGIAILCLWIAIALCSVPGAGLVAFACFSGALFWSSGVGVSVLFWMDERDRETCERKKAELRAQLYGGGRTA